MLGERALLELPLRMLLKTLYIPRGTERSREKYCDLDEEQRDCWSRERLVGRENWGDLGAFGSMGRRR